MELGFWPTQADSSLHIFNYDIILYDGSKEGVTGVGNFSGFFQPGDLQF